MGCKDVLCTSLQAVFCRVLGLPGKLVNCFVHLLHHLSIFKICCHEKDCDGLELSWSNFVCVLL